MNRDQLAPDLWVDVLLLLKGSNGRLIPVLIGSGNQGSSVEHLSSSGSKAVLGASCRFQALIKEYRRRHGHARVNSKSVAR